MQRLRRIVPAGTAADAQHGFFIFSDRENGVHKVIQPRFFLFNDAFAQRFILQQSRNFAEPFAGVLPAYRIHIANRGRAKLFFPLRRRFFQTALGLPRIAEGDEQGSRRKVFPLGKGDVTGKLPLRCQPETGQQAFHFPGILAAGSHLVAQQQDRAGNLRLRFDEPFHDQLCGLEIAFRIFAPQKSAVGYAENGNVIPGFRIFCFLFHVVADDPGYAGGSNDKALGVPGFHYIGDTSPQPFRASKDAVFFLQAGGNQGHGVHFFIHVVADDTVLGA